MSMSTGLLTAQFEHRNPNDEEVFHVLILGKPRNLSNHEISSHFMGNYTIEIERMSPKKGLFQ